MVDDMFKIHHKELSPKSIVEIHRRYGKFAYEGIYEALEKIGENQPTQLGAFLKPVAYDAASYAFFGEEFDSRETYEPFVRFDSKVHLLQAGIPAFVFRDAIAGRELIVDSLVKYLNKPHSDCSQFVVSVEELAKMANWVCTLVLFMGHFPDIFVPVIVTQRHSKHIHDRRMGNASQCHQCHILAYRSPAHEARRITTPHRRS